MNSINGLKICPRAPMITHLFFFADDSMMIESASGQRINLHKFELSCSRNVLSNHINELEMILKVKAMEKQGKYIGLPALVGRSKTQIFHFVRERVWKKLKG
ncbi:hypothetical protein HKD37_10G029199 [Glycine soja]|nr:hypothetical protein GmHk_10G029717 [Glycine max]